MSVTYTANGTQTVFSFPFDYLRKAYIKVEVNEETILVQGTDYSVNEKTVVFTIAPAKKTKLRIFRETDTTPLVSWADASVLRAKDMTVQQVQELHLLEEQRYWLQENAIIRDGKEWKARNFPIKEVGDPEDDTDAANKRYVDSNFMKLDDADDEWEGRNNPIKNIAQPAQPDDAASKRYVDNIISSIQALGSMGVICNTVEDMKANINLVPGQTVLTKGHHQINDYGSALYSIRALKYSDIDSDRTVFLNNNNVAERIANIGITNMFELDSDGYLCQEI